ncbi:MAG: hypothetical protein AAF581_00885 [Planctomycetota bacterium]
MPRLWIVVFCVALTVLAGVPAAWSQQPNQSAPQLNRSAPQAPGADGPTTGNAKQTEQPPSVLYGIPVAAGSEVALGPVDVAALLAADAQRAETDPHKVLRVGVPRPIDVRFVDGKWYSVPGVGVFWTVDVVADGAFGLRLQLESLDLPTAAALFVYDPTTPATARVYRANGATELWTGTVAGDRVRLEYFVPEAAAFDVQHEPFVVTALQHIYRDYLQAPITGAAPFGAGPCHNDVTCSPAWANIARSVAHIQFVDGGTFICTGQLLNPQNNDSTPYFLTANHCISTEAVANTTEFYWLYQTSTCNGSVPSLGSVPQSDYATLLATASSSDFTLLLIEGELPTGLHWSGWSSAPVANGTNMTGVHHPSGDYKRISFGTKISGPSDYVRSDWYDGPTEGGSSGSGIWLDSTQQLVGQLCCGPSSCGNESNDDYGAFASSYSAISSLLMAGTDDTQEPNDSCAAAGALADGTHGPWVVKSGDEDWFTLTVAAGSTLDIDVTFTDAWGDIDVQLFDSCGGTLLDSSTTNSDDEALSYVNGSGASNTVLLRVFLDSDTRATYGLVVSSGGGGGQGNNSCLTPTVITDGATPFSNVGATTDGPDEPGSCDFFSYTHIDSDVWFCYTAAGSGNVTVSLCGSAYDTKIAVYDGCGCPTAAPIACNDDSCSTQSELSFSTQAGSTYLLRVGGYQGATGSGTIQITFEPSDVCAEAVDIFDGVTNFTTIGATTDGPDEPGTCDFFGYTHVDNDIWFRYLAPCSGDLTISLCGSTYDTKLAVYATAVCPTVASATACNDDSCSTQSEVLLTAVAGQTYLIRIGGYQGATGTGAIDISCVATNDDCTSAEIVSNGTTLSTLLGATNDGDAACGSSQSSPDVWFSYTATCTGTAFINTCGTNDTGGVNQGMDTVLSVHTACPGTSGNQLDCNDDWPSGSDPAACTTSNSGLNRDSAVAVSVISGQQLFIRVATFGTTAPGDVQLNIDCIGSGPVNDACSNATLIGAGSLAGSLTAATNDGDATCGSSSGNVDLWYQFTAPANGTLSVNTCGSHDIGGVDAGMDTVLSLHSACPGTSGNQLDCNDDWPGGNDPTACTATDLGTSRDSALTLAMNSGVSCWIRVTHFGGSTPGDFTLNTSFATTCTPPTTITTQPVGGAFCTGAPISLTVAATGNGAVTYEWRKDGVPIPGATLPTFSIASAVTGDAGSYDCMVVAGCGSVISNVAIVTTMSCGGVEFIRGDCNNDASVNVADTVFVLGILFPVGTPNVAVCEDACDTNDDKGLNIADAIRILVALFGTPSQPLPTPYPLCGPDPAGAAFSCTGYSHCP